MSTQDRAAAAHDAPYHDAGGMVEWGLSSSHRLHGGIHMGWATQERTMSGYSRAKLAVVAACAALAAAPADQPKDRAACARSLERLIGQCRRRFPRASHLTLKDYLAQKDKHEWVIVDVRPKAERDVSIIPGAVSKEAFEAKASAHPRSRVLAYGTVGWRSSDYAARLAKRGLRAHSLAGGIMAWALAGQPLVDPKGKPTKRVHVHGDRWNVLPPGYQAVK